MFVYMSQPNLSALFAYICTIFYFFVTLFSIACMLSHGVVSIFLLHKDIDVHISIRGP